MLLTRFVMLVWVKKLKSCAILGRVFGLCHFLVIGGILGPMLFLLFIIVIQMMLSVILLSLLMILIVGRQFLPLPHLKKYPPPPKTVYTPLEKREEVSTTILSSILKLDFVSELETDLM